MFCILTELICHWAGTQVASFPDHVGGEKWPGNEANTKLKETESASWALQVYKDQPK